MENIFKAYQRSLLRQLETIEQAILSNDIKEAEKLINELIEDTQNTLED